MRVIQRPHPAGERVVALGTFDGVHLGHRALLATASEYAVSIGCPLRVCTFSRHPLEIIRPGFSPEILTTIPEKARQMAGLGVDEMELLPFDRAMADLEPEAFLERLRGSMRLRAVVAGWNYSFGRQGRGDAELLRENGRIHGYEVLIEPPATMEDGTAISSSLIRQALKEGRPETAAGLLGYRYSITGTVCPGKQQGHRLGFATANIVPWFRKALPKYGVYTCLLESDRNEWPAVANIGNQPTLPSGRVTIEAHILSGDPDLYGKKVRLSLIHMLREEKQFDSISELTEQIEKDKEQALRMFNMA